MKNQDAQKLTIQLQPFVLEGLKLLGERVQKVNQNLNPCENNASSYENKVFKMNAYNWLIGETSMQEFSFNFKYKNFYVSWYKYLGRSSFQNKELSENEWKIILEACLNSLPSFKY